MSGSRLLIIGLDAADKDLIELWATRGELPAFKSLLDTALWGDIENPRGLEAGSCWPTFYFGLSPAATGQYDGSRHFDPRSYDHVSYRPQSNSRDPIWSILSDAGNLCAVIDAPYSYPINDVNGIKIVDRGAHVPAGGGDYAELRTNPPELAQEIVELFGPDSAHGYSSDLIPVGTSDQVRAFCDLYRKRIVNKTELALHYWRHRPWDFFLCVFTEAHCVGHRCWHIHDPSHPTHDPSIVAAVGDPVKEIYIALDQAVGRLVEAARDEAKIIVYLSHGMGPRRSGTRLLDRILARLENQPVATQSNLLPSLVRAAWRRTPEAIRRPLKPLRETLSRDGFQPNRKRRHYFEVFANDRTGGIRINLAGREMHGTVQPGAEYEAICQQLLTDLSAVENAETGELLAREIIRTRDHYEGEYLDHLPDLLVTWNRSKPINAVRSPKIGTVDTSGLVFPRTGDHRPNGRFFGVSVDWPHQRLNEMIRAEDFYSTIARMFSVELEHAEGQPISALVPEENDACHSQGSPDERSRV